MCGFSIPGSTAFRTGNIHIRQELNVQRDLSGPVTDRTTQGTGVVGKIACFVSVLLRFFCFSEDLPQFIVYVGVGSDGGADVDADRRGIDQFDMPDSFRFDVQDMFRHLFPVADGVQCRYQTFQDQGRLSGSGDAGHSGQPVLRDLDRQWLYGVDLSRLHADDPVREQCTVRFFPGDPFCPGEITADHG